MRYLFAFVLLAVIAVFSATASDTPLKDPAQEAVARELMKEIRCLVCQNQSIEDSNADLAKDLRDIVREQVALGSSPDQVRAYLVDRYGDWVLLKPPVNRLTWFLWGSPFLLLAGVLIAVVSSRHKIDVSEPLTSKEQAQLDDLLRAAARDGQVKGSEKQ
ncbi:MAG: cytochrome c-type biogenesis protein CcmH [Kordiimonadaceae bacterium]|nr:cytochrome c-type biogenesis protein CcmH [Kordiimonadaceae bacterium]